MMNMSDCLYSNEYHNVFDLKKYLFAKNEEGINLLREELKQSVCSSWSYHLSFDAITGKLIED